MLVLKLVAFLTRRPTVFMKPLTIALLIPIWCVKNPISRFWFDWEPKQAQMDGVLISKQIFHLRYHLAFAHFLYSDSR